MKFSHARDHAPGEASPHPSPPPERAHKKQSRRRFLGQASGLTTAALAASSISLTPALGAHSTTAAAREIGPLNNFQRRQRALLQRVQAAQYNANHVVLPHISNGDDERYANRLASFTKTLPHNRLGDVDTDAYLTYLQALSSGDPAEFESIPSGGGTVKLANPQSGLCFSLEGADIHSFVLPAPPAFDTEALAGEMIELYWRALTRDVPFSQYGSHPLIEAAIIDLSRCANYSGVTTQTIFRGLLPGEGRGPLVSQLLFKPYNLGATQIQQLYRLPAADDDHMITYQNWLNIQNGFTPGRAIHFDAAPRFIRNGRDLGEYVHLDYSYQAFLNAALILQSYSLAALDNAHPYKTSTRQSGFATFGSPHLLDLVARVAALALRAAWFQKWQVHRRIRPEEFAGRVHNLVNNTAQYPISSKLLHSPALARLFSKNGTYLLPLAYAEGCPIHPSYPGGHATIAGACTTILKAWFDESFIIPNPVVANDEGTALVPFSGELTIGGELNKLASNLSYGRDTAGVHFRTDEHAGLRLGEALALSILTDFNACYNENFTGFTLTKFDGSTVTINQRAGHSGRGTRSL